MAEPPPDLLAALQASLGRAKAARRPHDHREEVPGCFRCDLSQHESEYHDGGRAGVDPCPLCGRVMCKGNC